MFSEKHFPYILAPLAFLALALPRAQPAGASDLTISEFMAQNESTLLDAEGEASDWIEIFNSSSRTVNLEGWSLTDEAWNPRKWLFPAFSLEPGRYLVVFASAKNRTVGSELHTNFKLGAEGEYLGLFEPDGRTAAAEFSPAYPPQKPDISFGLGQRTLPGSLVSAGSAAAVIAPTGPSLGLTWTGGNEPFDDSAAAGWTQAQVGVGYPGGGAGPTAPQPIAYWSFDRSLADLTGGGHTAVLHGATFSSDVPPKVAVGDSVSFDGTDDFISAEIDVSEGDHSLSLWFKGSSPNRGIFTVTDGDLGAGGYDRLLYLSGGNIAARVWNNETISSTGKNYADGRWHHVAHVVGGWASGQRLYVDGQLVASGAKATSDFDWQQRINIGFSNDGGSPYFQGLIDEVAIWDAALTALQIQALAGGGVPLALAGYSPWIRTDISGEMFSVNATAYLRIPFEVTLPLDFEALILRIRYDDGFAAYLNGLEVVRRNAPASLAFNSAAASDRPLAAAIFEESIDLGAHLGLLHAGTNILAIHGLNDRADSPDFLVAPELLRLDRAANRYLSPATPGAPNVYGVLDFVADTSFSTDRGFYFAPINVSIQTETEGARILYTTDGSVPSPDNAVAQAYTTPIRIAKTTTLRAAAFKDDYQPTNVDTHTYIFSAQVASQPASPPGLPTTWVNGYPADYGVDSNVVRNTLPGYSFEEAILSLPAMSVVASPDDFFGTSRGIYYNPYGRTRAWERQGSLELIHPDGSRGFQAECGFRMHGNSSRDHGFTPKHPFRVLFRREYGDAKLKFPLFDRTSVESFDELLLRGASTDSWPVVEGGYVLGVQRWSAAHATYMRDQWMRDSQIAMGHPSGDGIYVNLFVDGLYWGIYNVTERPRASFNAERLGGEEEEYDVLKDFAELEQGNMDAWNTMISLAGAGLATDAAYQKIQGNNPDGTRNVNFPVYIDVDNLIDYMILHIYAGAEDWAFHNWWAARRRGPESQGFKFFSWDQEISNDSLVRTHTLFETRFENPISSPSPSFLYGQCMANPSFRQDFIDRVHKHLFNDGLLSPEASAERWNAREAEIDKAMVGESARWGDSKRSPPYKREVEWLAEQEWMDQEYWPGIHPIAVQRFRNVGLYPDLEAPAFRVGGKAQHGGYFKPGDLLAMTVPSFVKIIDVPLVTAESSTSAHVPAGDALGTRWRSGNYVQGSSGEAWKTGKGGVGFEKSTGYESVIHIDVGAEMYGASGNNSVFIRLPFNVPDQATLDAFSGLKLEMLYDDGFVAYLNGARIAAANAPEESSLAWNSVATTSVEASLASPSRFDVGAFLGELKVGSNLLAIHGMNFSNNSSDMLILAELVGRVEDADAPAGTIKYTTDGSDPRSPAARTYEGPMPLDGTTLVKARALDQGEWSALNEAIFIDPDELPLRVTEIMYHPGDPEPGSLFDADDLDYLEIQNVGRQPVGLFGVRIEGGIQFDFSTSRIARLLPGEYAVVVEDEAAFAARYDVRGMNVAGEYGSNLSNSGEPIVLKGRLGEKLLEFRYKGDWYAETDGGGYSLVIRDSLGPISSWSEKEAWRPSHSAGGSPGALDPGDGTEGGRQLQGDLNQDGELDMADPIALLLRLFVGSVAPLPCGATLASGGNVLLLDINGDTVVGLSDAIYTLNYLFRGGPPPALGPGCVRMDGCPERCVP